ncbi:hypothetical protein BASA50_001755 [Batrachochytrium salamandrivorans]|uniref:UBA domain-containing protein n=1 Tax=Batrachochytrium salamandrivorans TaxID=1357716 RepID=A0ABQ8FND4_9FUNG|nr:hypothetical protein BASA50_001755 [Batrachochytrium salamandrivorans]KAJ1343982.1 hypothetical protein BSLG_001462 [Batrachochytrium salamandrivorans]
MSGREEDFAGQLRVLQSMGFSDIQTNRCALKQSMGRINDAIELITTGTVNMNPSGNANSNSSSDQDNRPLGEIYTSLPGQTRQHHALNQNIASPTTGGASAFNSNTQPIARSGPLYIFPVLDMAKQQAVLQLADLGFTDEGKIRHALHKAKWDVQAAAEFLVEQFDDLLSGFSGQPVETLQPTTPSLGRSAGASRPPLPHRDLPQPTASNDPYAAFRDRSATDAFSYTPGRTLVATASSAAAAAASDSHNPFAAASSSSGGGGGGGIPFQHQPSPFQQHHLAIAQPPLASTMTNLSAPPKLTPLASKRYTSDQKVVLAEFDPFSDDHQI